MKLKKGDNVKIIKGKDKGKTGNIEKAFPREKKVLVPNVNQYKRHLKARSQQQPSEIVTLTKPMPISSVVFICPKCKKQSRLAYKLEKNTKLRICVKCKSEV